MAYDEALAARVRDAMTGRDGISERKMFGGLCLMLHGNMFAGVMQGRADAARGTRPLRAGPGEAGRAAHGLHRPPDGRFHLRRSPRLRTEAGLKSWLNEALGFVETLPPKSGVKPAKTRRK